MENEIIDFYSEKQMRQYSVFRKPKSGGDIGRNLISLVHYKGLKSRHERFDKMRKKHLALSRRCTAEKEVYEVANAYDTLICGSDQIWNTEARDYSDAYFMAGVEKKKISYGIAFSIIFEKQFCRPTCVNEDGTLAMDDRIDNLLSQLGLNERTVKYSDVTSKLLQREIDYTLVREKLDRIRENGIHYLETALLD